MRNIPLRIDYSREFRRLQPEITKAIFDVIEQGRFILKEDLQLFESEFARFCGTKYTVGVASGTGALHLALRVLGLRHGDEVITNAMSFNATSEAIFYCQAKPVFVDVVEQNLSIDVAKIEEAVTEKTKALLVVHLYGIPADMEKIVDLCRKYKIFLIEDCAQAHGALYNDRCVGTFGDFGCFSFMPSKNLGCYGEGGGIITANERYLSRLKSLRNHGLDGKYVHTELGFSDKLDNLQAAILRVKLKHLRAWNDRRCQLAQIYNEQLNQSSAMPLQISGGSIPSYYTYVIRSKNRDELLEKLRRNSVNVEVFYPVPLHLQPSSKFLGYRVGDLPVVERLSKEILSLPMHPFLTDDEVNYIAQIVNSYSRFY